MINIVVPVYNSAKNLETCLFSLVNQTIKDLEIIHTKKINRNVDFLYLFATAILIFLSRATRTLYSHIICIICIYNITCISGFSRLGNIYIICIIRTIYIINISLLWTNCGHRPHPFTAIIIPYFKVQ